MAILNLEVSLWVSMKHAQHDIIDKANSRSVFESVGSDYEQVNSLYDIFSSLWLNLKKYNNWHNRSIDNSSR